MRFKLMRSGRFGIGLAALCLLPALAAATESKDEKLWHHRNLGKAFYENSATQYEAVTELEKALALAPSSARERVNYGLALLRAGKAGEGLVELEKAQKQDPSIPHTWFNLGIAYKRESRYEEAVVQLEKMAELVPDEAITQFNLGVLYKLVGRGDEAMARFERAAELDPGLAGPHFQLSTAYRQAKRMDDAKREMALFRELKKRDAGAAVPEDLEWSYYSELVEVLDPARAAAPAPSAELAFEPRRLVEGLEAVNAGLAVLDADGDGRSDLLSYSARGARLFVGGEAVEKSGLEALSGRMALVPGDFDNDGLADLCALTARGASLWRNVGGRFERHSATLPAGRFRTAVWLDYDHDYDLDLVLLGADAALVRNQGEAGFSDRSGDFPFAAGRALAGVVVDVVADTQGMDLAVAYADRDGVLYRDRLGGNYEAVPLPALSRGTSSLLAQDLDHDGWTDLLAASREGAFLLVNGHRGDFEAKPAPEGTRAPAVVADLENRARSELVSGGAVYRHLGSGRFGSAEKPAGLAHAAALAEADFDADGRTDLAMVDIEGRLLLLRNATRTEHRWLRVGLEGVKNLKLAPGAEVEVKAGSVYQKRLYDGAPLHFGLGVASEVDTVRITWPNGLIQNESRQATGRAVAFEEAQRLSGSCPMIYTWNGHEFEFITDVLGVAPLGASAGNGEYFPVDHDEVIQIAGESLVPRDDGDYEIRIVEELREVAFIDRLKLVAVDHPAEIEVYTNDKFKGPPFPEFRLFGVREPRRPSSARDHHGRDVLERLLLRDRTYPDGFARDYAGVAEEHFLELDFGDAAAGNRAVLVLSGWVDWADGSTFLGASQDSASGLVMPYLQVKDGEGRWQTVIEDMGIPAGKPKTIVVDLEGRFLSPSREVRIVTNLCVYWDEIFLSEEPAPPTTRLTDLEAKVAELSFGGFSKVVIHPERKQPEHFIYGERRPLSMWNPTRGLYTRYGDVRPLLGRVDDRFVIMGSGDELRLRFAADELPVLPAGWERDFLLYVDGWAKDGDANTAHSQTVGPLPYHGMPQYPYAEPHRYPDDGEHNLYREYYNTRPAFRLIRPLTEGLSPAPGAEP